MATRGTTTMDATNTTEDPEKVALGTHRTQLEDGQLYYATVTNPVDWGVFVSLTPKGDDELSGLIHEENLVHGELSSPNEYESGDKLVVEYDEAKSREGEFDNSSLAFNAVDVVSDDEFSQADREELDERIQDNTENSIEDIIQNISREHGVDPIDDAVSMLCTLQNEDYVVEEYTPKITENGDRVSIELELSSDE